MNFFKISEASVVKVEQELRSIKNVLEYIINQID